MFFLSYKQKLYSYSEMRNMIIYLFIFTAALPCIFSIALPKASQINFKNFTSSLFVLSYDGKKGVFTNHSMSLTQKNNGINNNLTVKFWDIQDFNFKNLGYHIFQFSSLWNPCEIYWFGDKIIYLGRINEYFISNLSADGLITKENEKRVPQIQWYADSMKRLSSDKDLTFFAMDSVTKSGKSYLSKIYQFSLANQQIVLTHECFMSKAYAIIDYFHSVFLLKEYYCLAVAYPNTTKLTIQCCSSNTNTSIFAFFDNMTKFKSQFRIAPISQTYQAYLVYQSAYIQKIKFDPLSKQFTIISLFWNISKIVDGAVCINGNLVDIQEDDKQDKIIVSFYYENKNIIHAYQRLVSSTHLILSYTSNNFDNIRFQILPNFNGFFFSLLRVPDYPHFFVKFLQRKESSVGIITLLVFLSIVFLTSMLCCLKLQSFTRIKLIASIRASQVILEIFCFILGFSFIFLKVVATDTDQINYDGQSTLGAGTLSGSFWLRLLEKIFLLLSLIITINELRPQFDYSNFYMKNHIRHGLQANSFISLVFSKLILKSIIMTFISFGFLLMLEQNYNNLPTRTFQLNFNMACSIITCIITLISFTLLTKLLSKFTNSYWKTLIILYLLYFGISNWSDLFYRNEQIDHLDYFLSIVWLPSLYNSYIQLIYQAELRFIQSPISQVQMEMLLLFHFLMISLLYIAYVKWIERINKIDRLVENVSKKQQDSNINYSGSDQSSFHIDKTELFSLLNVYIPIKMNLKNRKEKNKVLQNIRFVGNRGEVLSFIDEKNESRAALFKILTGQQKSDQVIELGLVGKVSYSERVKVSYCLDYDLSFPEVTVQEHLQFYYWLKKPLSSKLEMKSQVQHILDEFQISDDFRLKKAKQLSGGYLKKMCLACAFVGDPDVIILDQPTLGLDIKFQKYFQHKIKTWKQNKLLIIFTADHNEANALSDKVWYFQNQKILRYEQAKKIYLKIQIKLEFLTENAFTFFSPAIHQFIKSTFCNQSLITTAQVKKWLITIDKPYKQGVWNQIKCFMKKIADMNRPIYLCHFDYRMLQTSLTHLELIDKYSDSESFCKKCEGLRLYQHLKAEVNINNNYFQGISIGEDSRTRQLNKAEKLLSMLSQQNMKKNIWVSQILSIIYRRYKLSRIFKAEKGQIFYGQISLWIYWLAIYTQPNLHIKTKIITNFILYLILQMQTIQFYVSQKEFGHYDYYKSIGLDWVYYWIANIAYDFIYLLIPLIVAVIIQYNIVNFVVIEQYDPQIQQSIISCILLALSFSSFQVLISLFLSKSTQKHTLLFTIMLFPLLLQLDPYFTSYSSKELGFGYLSYLLFPWSVNQILQQNKNYAMYYLFAIAQLFLMMILILIIEQRRESYKEKQGRIYLGDFDHSNSEETLSARRQIEDIKQKKQFVYGEDIVNFYGGKVSLRNVSFYVKEGQILGVFGHNGSGKTTLFKIIVRRLSQSSGVVLYFGKRRKQLNLIDNIQISYCPQVDHFDPNLSLQQNLITIGKIKGVQSKYLSKFIALFLGYLGLKGNQQVPVRDLSVGERKKAHFIAAFLGFPKLIICDQISTGIDNESSRKVMALLRAYSSFHKKCVILTSHNIHEGEQFCDRVMLLKNGSLKASNTAFRLRIDASQQLYKIIIQMKRQDNQIIRARKKQKVIFVFNQIEYKKNVFEDQYCVIYSVDMRQNVGNIFESIFNMYVQGVIDKFSFYKHDLEEVAKTYMSKAEDQNLQ